MTFLACIVFFKLRISHCSLALISYMLQVFVANIGDAKAVVARSSKINEVNDSNGCSPLKAIVLTREHKAIYPQERVRIQKVRNFYLYI